MPCGAANELDGLRGLVADLTRVVDELYFDVFARPRDDGETEPRERSPLTLVEGGRNRTGVTAIVPHAGNVFRDKVAGGVFVGNAFGKLAGSTQVHELGTIEAKEDHGPLVPVSTYGASKLAGEALIQFRQLAKRLPDNLELPFNAGLQQCILQVVVERLPSYELRD